MYRTSTHSLTRTARPLRVLGLGTATASGMSGFSSAFPLSLTLENVAPDKTSVAAQYANIGLSNSNITPTGAGVTTGAVSGSGAVPSCSFPTFPGL